MRLVTIALIVSIVLLSTTSAQTKVTKVDYVFLVDVSASMAGEVGHPNIFPSVKKTIQEFVSKVELGSTVFFFPFADDILGTRKFELQRADDVDAVKGYVESLLANGQRTAIYNSIDRVLQEVDHYRQQQGGGRPVVFFVYTDGDDNVSKGWTLSSILDHFNLKRGKDDWLFYTELGLPPSAQKEQQFKKYDRMQYVREEEGSVHPIIQVETVIPFLNFGNLKQTPKSTRVEKFIVRAKDPLPQKYTVAIEPEFEDLKSQGAYAQVTPAAFYPSENVNLELSLLNSQGLTERLYTGHLRLVSSDPLVIVVPNEIEASFLFEPERIVEVLPSSGESFPLDFGDLKLDREKVLEANKNVNIRFNAQAERSGEKLELRILEDAGNPQHLNIGSDLLLAQIKGDGGRVSSEAKQLDITFKANPQFSAGVYRGEIVFEGENLRIEGSGLHEVKGNLNARGLSWSITLKSAPWPWWISVLVWIGVLLVLALIVFALYCLKEGVGPSEGIETLFGNWFPVLDGEFEVIEPESKQGVHSLKGRKAATVGQGGEILPEIDASFRIEPIKHAGKRAFKITAHEDSMVKVDGSPIVAEYVYDGQVIELGKAERVKIRYNNLRLPPRDN